MWEYFRLGGPVMWPLLALSVLGVAVGAWRWIVIHRASRALAPFMAQVRARLVDADVGGALAVCSRTGGPVAAVVKAGLARFGRPPADVELFLEDTSSEELTLLERGLPVLATIATVAPLLGFLGTVTGMINSFEALAAVGLDNPAEVAKGISEALITTAAGLIIAIPVQMAYNYLVTRVNALAHQMEAAGNLVLEAFADLRAADGGARRA